MSKNFAAAAGLIFAMACQKTTVRKELIAMGPVILPNSMCAEHGTTAVSNDREGERMICEMQNQLGTHIPRCVCVDEGFTERERELAHTMLRNINSIDACGGGGANPAACLLGKVGSINQTGTR